MADRGPVGRIWDAVAHNRVTGNQYFRKALHVLGIATAGEAVLTGGDAANAWGNAAQIGANSDAAVAGAQHGVDVATANLGAAKDKLIADALASNGGPVPQADLSQLRDANSALNDPHTGANAALTAAQNAAQHPNTLGAALGSVGDNLHHQADTVVNFVGHNAGLDAAIVAGAAAWKGPELVRRAAYMIQHHGSMQGYEASRQQAKATHTRSGGN